MINSFEFSAGYYYFADHPNYISSKQINFTAEARLKL